MILAVNLHACDDASYWNMTARMFATLSRESQINLSYRWLPCVRFPISQTLSDFLNESLRIVEERAREDGS